MSMDDPRTRAEREAAQRADEAELLTIVTDDPECIECKARTPDTCGGCDEPVCDGCHLEHMGVRHRAAIARLSPPTCFYCEHHGGGVVPATRQITFVDNDAPRAEWVCDDCAHTYFPEHTHPCAICKTRPVNPDDGEQANPRSPLRGSALGSAPARVTTPPCRRTSSVTPATTTRPGPRTRTYACTWS
jgi:hypothetical protein